jgi:hypothetical protein
LKRTKVEKVLFTIAVIQAGSPARAGARSIGTTTQSGMHVSGDAPRIAIVKTNPGYEPAVGHAGTADGRDTGLLGDTTTGCEDRAAPRVPRGAAVTARGPAVEPGVHAQSVV